MTARLDLAGQRFFRLVALQYIRKNKSKQAVWLCQCDCGNTCEVVGYKLKIGWTKSCGCWKLEEFRKRTTKHGMAKDPNNLMPEYRSWVHMKKRCYDPTNQDYRRYGGRGIAVSPNWRDDFAQFYKDMGPRPSVRHSLERLDNNQNYSASNCVWALPAQQSRNKSNNVWIEYNGRRMIMADWERELRLPRGRLRWYFVERGLPFAEAVEKCQVSHN